MRTKWIGQILGLYLSKEDVIFEKIRTFYYNTLSFTLPYFIYFTLHVTVAGLCAVRRNPREKKGKYVADQIHITYLAAGLGLKAALRCPPDLGK